jgi:hypothetical protein
MHGITLHDERTNITICTLEVEMISNTLKLTES